MAKIQNISNETKKAIQRKSAYSLPNNPTDSGYKANDIRNAFYKPIIDAANSAITEIDRVVNELNTVLEQTTSDFDVIESTKNDNSTVIYVGSNGLTYSLIDDEFSVTGYEGDSKRLVIPSSVYYNGAFYSVVAIGKSAFTKCKFTYTEIPSSVTEIGDYAFSGIEGLEVKLNGKVEKLGNTAFYKSYSSNTASKKASFIAPAEYKEHYNDVLSVYAKTIGYYNTVENNANNIAELDDKIDSEIAELDDKKLTKNTSTSTYYRVYGVTPLGAQIPIKIGNIPNEVNIPIYSNGEISVNDPTLDNSATNKQYVENRFLDFGANIDFTIDPTTYVMTLRLKNEGGTVLSTGTVDLPLESMILGASYADGVLTLNIKTADGSMDNNPINVNISDLISGLVSNTTFKTEVDRLDERVDAEADRLDARVDSANQDVQTLSNEVSQKEIYAHAAYHAEEAQTSRSYTKGGKIDKKFREIEAIEGASISMSMDSDYKLTIKLLNSGGEVLSSGMVDLPIESLISKASYSNGVLTLTFQSGDKANVDISSLISGLVSESRTINGQALSANITLSASDVGAYSKSETYTKNETSNLVNSAKQELLLAIDEKEVVGYAYSSTESEKASGYTKGGAIDKKFNELLERIVALENK